MTKNIYTRFSYYNSQSFEDSRFFSAYNQAKFRENGITISSFKTISPFQTRVIRGL
jgi:hypothetical protein